MDPSGWNKISDAWPAQRANPAASGVAFRFGCGGYNVVVRSR